MAPPSEVPTVTAPHFGPGPKAQNSVGQEEVNFLHYFFVIRKHWLLIVITVALFLTAGVFYTARQPRIYRASSLVAIIPPQVRTIGNIKMEPAYNLRLVSIKTLEAFLSSRKLAKKIRQRIPPQICLSFFGKEKSKVEVQDIQNALSSTHQRRTNLISITSAGLDPEGAAIITNLATQVFIEENNRRAESSQTQLLKYLNQEIPSLEKKMADTRKKLLQAEEKNLEILYTSKDEKSFNFDMIHRLRRELQEINIKLISLEVKYKKILQLKEEEDLSKILALAIFKDQSLIEKLRTQKAQLEDQLRELKLRYKGKHPRRKSLSQSLREIDDRIKEEISIYLQRQEKAYLDLKDKKDRLKKMLQKQYNKSINLKKKHLQYERYRQEYKYLERTYNNFLAKLKELDTTSNYRISTVQKIDEAVPPDYPFKPNRSTNYLLSCILGLFAGIALSFLLESLDDTAKSVEEIKEIVEAPILGFVPYISSKKFSGKPARAVEQKSNSVVAEAFRAIGTAVYFDRRKTDQKSFVVSSATAQEGKTTIATNMALSFARAGHKVLLIDCDLRKPRLRKLFELEPGKEGTSQLLQGEKNWRELLREVNSHLDLITAGKLPKDPYQSILNSSLEEILKEMEEEYRYVIIDSPPMGITSDAFLLSQKAGALFFVISIHKAKKSMLRQLFQRIENMEVPLWGTVLNDTSGEFQTQRQHYYRHYYGYYGRSYGYGDSHGYFNKNTEPKKSE